MKNLLYYVALIIFTISLITSCTKQELNFDHVQNDQKIEDSLQTVKNVVKDSISNIDPIEPEGRKN